MRLLVATDAWHPQVNGVVRSLEQTAQALCDLAVETEFLSPEQFTTVPLPSYPEIRLSLASQSRVAERVTRGRFDAIHVATEGPIGLAARRYCRTRGLAFTTSYHTRFPEYLRARMPVPLGWSYAWLRRFHNAGAATMVSTDALRRELSGRGFERLRIWSRGVDTELFRPRPERAPDLPRPVFLFVGRLAVEKNVPAFLGLDLPGTKVVVGDGPDRARLQARFPDAIFLGTRCGDDLAGIYAAADAFVFPSLTDTYGIVVLEALASGVPVAAYPVPGPMDALARAGVGVTSGDLAAAARAALAIPAERCRAFALAQSWRRSAREFLDHLVPLSHGADRPAAVPPGLAREMTALTRS